MNNNNNNSNKTKCSKCKGYFVPLLKLSGFYYKSCKNEEELTIVESIVLNKLKAYKEKANRDRFILPLEKDISFFTDIIDNCINFF